MTETLFIGVSIWEGKKRLWGTSWVEEGKKVKRCREFKGSDCQLFGGWSDRQRTATRITVRILNLRFSEICCLLWFPAPSECLNFQERRARGVNLRKSAVVSENLHFGLSLSPQVRPLLRTLIFRRGEVGAYKVQAYPREWGSLEGTSPKVFRPPGNLENSLKQGIWSSHFLRDLSQVVRRTPWDTPVPFYTRTSPLLTFKCYISSAISPI